MREAALTQCLFNRSCSVPVAVLSTRAAQPRHSMLSATPARHSLSSNHRTLMIPRPQIEPEVGLAPLVDRAAQGTLRHKQRHRRSGQDFRGVPATLSASVRDGPRGSRRFGHPEMLHRRGRKQNVTPLLSRRRTGALNRIGKRCMLRDIPGTTTTEPKAMPPTGTIAGRTVVAVPVATTLHPRR